MQITIILNLKRLLELMPFLVPDDARDEGLIAGVYFEEEGGGGGCY